MGLAAGKISPTQLGPSPPHVGELPFGLWIVPDEGAQLEELQELIKSLVHREALELIVLDCVHGCPASPRGRARLVHGDKNTRARTSVAVKRRFASRLAGGLEAP